jgi:NADPH:quinone reductase-like Zn-dependent oxidoreductase
MADSLPKKQKAVVSTDDGSLVVSSEVDVPQMEDDMAMVRTRAVGLNPIDTKMKGGLAAPGAIAGMDFAGEVLAVGPQFTSPAQINPGDRVCGAVIGYQQAKPAIGGFAEVVGATDAGLLKMPDDWSFEQGASFGVAVGTMGLALFRSLGVPGTPQTPTEEAVDVFVYGGSTTTGTLALQLLKLWATLLPLLWTGHRNTIKH